MPEKPPIRKERIPLSPEELHYFIKLKKLKQAQKIEAFKASRLYKTLSYINIALIALVTYFVLSVLILTRWETSTIKQFSTTFGEFNNEIQQRSIFELNIITSSQQLIQLKPSMLFREPQQNETIYIGKDYLFGKSIKAKLNYDERAFWENKTYPGFSLCVFALLMSLYVYRFDKHLTANGLLTALGLLSLSSLYFICV
jgi:hypothetical protein